MVFESYVVVHNIAKRHNVGTLARSATAFGVTELILVGRRDFNAFGSHGSTTHVKFRHFHSLGEACIFLKEKDCDICGVEIADGALPVNQHPFNRNTAFLLGNEGSGLSAKEYEICDFFIYIPQYGCGTASLNVTVAASIVLHQFGVWAGFAERTREGSKFVVAERPVKQAKRNYCAENVDTIMEERKSRHEAIGFFDENGEDANIMCPASHRRSSGESTKTTTWISEAINGGSFQNVDLDTGTNGWASPPGDLFSLRSKTYLTKNDKSPAGEYLLSPAGVDWLKSPTRLDNVLSRSDNRVMHALRVSQPLGSFVFAVNIQLPTGRDHHSLVMYFATDEPIQPGTLFHKFVNGSDAYRNSRFKIVNRLLKGPWLLKAAVEHYSACLLSNVLKVNYHRGDNYLEIDVDVGSSTIATAVLKLGLGYTTYATMDMGFVVEAQFKEELPEKLIGAVRICQMEMSSATVVSSTSSTMAESAPGSR